MNKEPNTTLVPKLRFPEFKEAVEWRETALGQCLIKHPDYGINAAAVPYSSNLPTYLRITDISEDGLFLNNQKVSVGKEVTKDNYLDQGDIVLARTGASVGKSYKYKVEDGELVFAGFLIRVKPNRNKLNSELLFQYLSTDKYWRWVNFTSARSGQPGINGNEYASMPILLPSSLEEQQKIADCFSSLDELIMAEIRKLDILKAHKKGLMQQLIPTEGEKVPKLRFDEFKDNADWTQVPLEEISHKVMVGIASAATHAYRKSGVILFRNQNIKEGHLDDNDILFIDELYEKEHKNKRLAGGDLLIARTGYPGTACVVPDKFEGSQSFTTLITRPNSEIVDSHFLCLYINSAQGKAFFESKQIGGGQKNVNAGSLSKMPVPCPSLEEQKKIACCLSSLDDMITEQAEKIEALKIHKKGLMQQLFPQTE